MSARPRIVVCGTGFGRVHLEALRRSDAPAELAGIVARGSERSRACAEALDVPLYADVDDVPADVELACVAVMAGVNGGRGTELAERLMTRGIHVLQESPMHHDELAESLRTARRCGVVHRLNTHYVHVEPVRRFLAAASALLERQEPLFVDAACGIQVAFNLVDILGRAIGRLRPWAFAAGPALDGGDPPPFRTLAGSIGGVPVTLRIQNELDPSDPDNNAHLLHRVTLGTEGGTLTLVNTHGPVLWSPRPHFPPAGKHATALHEADAPHLDFPSASPLGPAEAPSYREILRDLWPAAAGRALDELRLAVADGEDPLRLGQYHLSVARCWQDATSQLGYPDARPLAAPRPLAPDALIEATEEVTA